MELSQTAFLLKQVASHQQNKTIIDLCHLISFVAIVTWNEVHYENSELSLKENPVYETLDVNFSIIQTINGTNITEIITQQRNITKNPAGFLDNHNELTCKLSDYLRNVIYLMSSWLVVCFTVDRYIAVRHPLQRSRLCTEKRAKLFILIVFIACLLTQIHKLIFIKRISKPGHNVCHAQRKYE